MAVRPSSVAAGTAVGCTEGKGAMAGPRRGLVTATIAATPARVGGPPATPEGPVSGTAP